MEHRVNTTSDINMCIYIYYTHTYCVYIYIRIIYIYIIYLYTLYIYIYIIYIYIHQFIYIIICIHQFYIYNNNNNTSNLFHFWSSIWECKSTMGSAKNHQRLIRPNNKGFRLRWQCDLGICLGLNSQLFGSLEKFLATIQDIQTYKAGIDILVICVIAIENHHWNKSLN